MRGKRFFTLIVAVFAVMAFAAPSFAAQKLNQKTTVPNIPKSACEQAGSVTEQIDLGTKMREADQIELTLSNGVTVCKTIDFFLMLTDGLDSANMTTVHSPEIISDDPTDPVHDTDLNSQAEVVDLTETYASIADAVAFYTTYQTGFLVRANYGSQIVYITLVKRNKNTGRIEYQSGDVEYFELIYSNATETSTSWIVELFNEKTNDDHFYYDNGTHSTAATGYQSTSSARGVYYLDSIADEHNVLCVNTLNYDGEVVDIYPNSRPKEIPGIEDNMLTFSQDTQIAHIMSAVQFNWATCFKDACPNVSYEMTTDQAGNPVAQADTFDPGNYTTACVANQGVDAWTSVGTCNTEEANSIVIGTSQAFSSNTQYSLEVILERDGVSSTATTWGGQPTVYWTKFQDKYASNCDCGAAAATPVTTITGWTHDTVAGSATYSPWKMSSSSFQGNASYNAILIDLGMVNFSASTAGTINVRVRLIKEPCGTLFDDVRCIATLVPKCDTAAIVTGTTLFFPYSTGSQDAQGYWSGVGVTNYSTAAGVANFTFYDKDGATATYTSPSIAAHSQYVVGLSALMENASASATMDLTKSLYFYVDCNFGADGILMIGSDAGIHGYLPRLPGYEFFKVE